MQPARFPKALDALQLKFPDIQAQMPVFSGVSYLGIPEGPYDDLAPFHGALGKWLPVVRDHPLGAIENAVAAYVPL